MDDFSFSENQLNTQAYEYMRENLLKEKERRILKQNEMENELKNMETKDKHLNDEINIEIERLDELIESIKLKSEGTAFYVILVPLGQFILIGQFLDCKEISLVLYCDLVWSFIVT